MVALFQNVARMIDALPCDFRDVHESFEVCVEADEGAEIRNGRDFSFHRVSDFEFCDHAFLLSLPDRFFQKL